MLKEAISGEKFFILGAPSEAGEKLDYYFDNFNKRRIEKNISLKIILNHGHLRESKLKSLEKTQVKVFPKHITTPAWINIFGDYVATFNLQDKPIAFVLKSSKTADSYRQYFDLMWKNAN
jgi:biotin synthase-like enzyme